MSNLIYDGEEALDRVDADLDFLTELTNEFLSSLPEQLANLKESADKSDPISLEKKAHSLKGALNNLSAKKSALSAHAIEMAGKSADLSEISKLLITFENDLKEFTLAFKTFIKNKLV